MNAKHTPGPWRIDGQFDAEVRVSIVSSRDFVICEIEPFLEEWEPEEIANAHLIAATPELLEALKSTLSTLDFAIQKGVIECHGVREAALSAISKAEGCV